jgi:hypothetical protein
VIGFTGRDDRRPRAMADAPCAAIARAIGGRHRTRGHRFFLALRRSHSPEPEWLESLGWQCVAQRWRTLLSPIRLPS